MLCNKQSPGDAEVLATMTCLDSGPDGACLPVSMEDRVDGKSCLGSSEQDQQHEGGQHSLVNTVAAEAKCDIRYGHKACHHINQACWIPAEVYLCISATPI